MDLKIGGPFPFPGRARGDKYPYITDMRLAADRRREWQVKFSEGSDARWMGPMGDPVPIEPVPIPAAADVAREAPERPPVPAALAWAVTSFPTPPPDEVVIGARGFAARYRTDLGLEVWNFDAVSLEAAIRRARGQLSTSGPVGRRVRLLGVEVGVGAAAASSVRPASSAGGLRGSDGGGGLRGGVR